MLRLCCEKKRVMFSAAPRKIGLLLEHWRWRARDLRTGFVANKPFVSAVAIFLLAVAGLVFDALTPQMISVGLFYVALALAGFWFSKPTAALSFALLSTPLIIIGYWITIPDNSPPLEAWTNRFLAIGTVWLTALFVWRIRVLEHELQRHVEIADTLSREISHRVGNSLQLVASSLRLQAASAHSEEARQVLETAGSRIVVVGKIQRMLSHSGPDRSVDACPFITDLVGDVRSTLPNDKLSITVQADSTELTSTMAIMLGSLLVELVNNALKHAFREGMVGTVGVRFTTSEVQHVLEVEDDGVGIDPAQTVEGFGTQNITLLARLLDATITRQPASRSTTRPGTMWRLVRPCT
jgi:two-component sensor histidine kinase